MLILGIDTSCDDTSAAVVADGRGTLSNVVHSQVDLHQPHGGVVPELASREHLNNIIPVVQKALEAAGVRMQDLGGVAVTVGPGLVGSLLVGLYYAKAVSFVHKLPLVAVNHLEGHLLSVFLESEAPEFPFVALTVSGGHTQLYSVRGFGDYLLLGQTRDDAAGEAYDKVAKVFGLGYPGGRVIEELARRGIPGRVSFPRAWLGKDSFDFSFSGLKTAVSIYHQQWAKGPADAGDASLADMATGFQEAVVDVLVRKTMHALEETGGGAVVVAGGVACNGYLRARMSAAAAEKGVKACFPRPSYCTDNGAMIALAGYHRLLNEEVADLMLDARSKFPISELERMKDNRRERSGSDET